MFWVFFHCVGVLSQWVHWQLSQQRDLSKAWDRLIFAGVFSQDGWKKPCPAAPGGCCPQSRAARHHTCSLSCTAAQSIILCISRAWSAHSQHWYTRLWLLASGGRQASCSASPSPGTPSTARGVQTVRTAAATPTALPVNTGSKCSWSTGRQGCNSDQTSELWLRRGFFKAEFLRTSKKPRMGMSL